MNDNQPGFSSHPAETLLAAYAIGRCSPAEQAKIDEHCFICEECRTRLSILLRVSAADASDMERRQLERLFPLGMETIAQARQNGGQSTHQPNASNVPNASNLKDLQYIANQTPLTQLGSQGLFGAILSGFRQRRFQLAATLALVLTFSAAGGFYYWYSQSRSPVQNSLKAMQRSYRLSRPLEARVTGGFNYQPYERKRGGVDNSDIDRDQINYAMAELTKAVASHPTAETRHALGRLYLLLGDFDKAQDQMTEALLDSPQNAKLYTDIAALYYERSKYSDTVTLLSKAVEHYDSALKIEPKLAEAWFNRALCYEGMALYDKARLDWEKYLEIDPDSPWSKEARDRLKKLKLKAANLNESRKNIDLALRKAAESNDEAALRQLISQNFVAAQMFSTGELFDNYLSASLSQSNELAESYLKTIRQFGQLTDEIKGDHFVTDLVDFAARASPEVKKGMQSVRLMLRQADKEFERSSYDISFKHSQSAYNAAESIGDKYHAELASLKLLRSPNIQTKSENPTNLGTELVFQAERRRHRLLLAQAHIAIANIYISSSQIALALENSLQATVIAKELGDTDTAIRSLGFSSTAYTRSGDYEHALDKNFELLSFLRDQPVSPPRRLQAYHQVGETFFLLDKYHLALDYQEEALKIAMALGRPLLLAGTNGRIGLTLWKLARNDEAKRHLDEAISKMKLVEDQATRQLLQIELNTTLGDVFLEQGKTDESIFAYNQAIQVIQGTNNRVYLTAIHQGLASAYLKQGKILKAESELQIGISLVERDRQQINDASGRSVFLANRQNVYHAMVDFQLNTKHSPATAFFYAENAKSRNLLDTLSQKITTKWHDGRVVLSLVGNARPLNLKQVQRSLPQNIQLVSYTVTEKKMIIWYVTSNTIVAESADCNSEQLQRSVSSYLSDLRSRRDIETVNRQAMELYRLLIQPIAEKLDRNRLLCIIPDGILFQLPFAALLSPGSNRYLIEDFSVTMNPSASVMVKTSNLASAKRGNSSEAFIGVSNPRFNYKRFPGLPTLPSAEEEVARASSLYPQSELIKNEQATETALVRGVGRYEIVHIAGHILIDGQSPLQSSILLAEDLPQATKEKNRNGEASDGTLQAIEIYQLKLPRTRLVILSGCQSAVGNYTQGEALSLLTQAFFASGVPAVIASLWEVDDALSAEIMYSFHYNHRVKHQEFGEALSQALRSLIYESEAKRRHPYYWAAFLLSGHGLDNKVHLN